MNNKQPINNSIYPKTILGSLLGSAIGATVGGLVFMFALRYLWLLAIPSVVVIYFICYGCIRLFTRQTIDNNVIFIASLLAWVLAIICTFALWAPIFSKHHW